MNVTSPIGRNESGVLPCIGLHLPLWILSHVDRGVERTRFLCCLCLPHASRAVLLQRVKLGGFSAHKITTIQEFLTRKEQRWTSARVEKRASFHPQQPLREGGDQPQQPVAPAKGSATVTSAGHPFPIRASAVASCYYSHALIGTVGMSDTRV